TSSSAPACTILGAQLNPGAKETRTDRPNNVFILFMKYLHTTINYDFLYCPGADAVSRTFSTCRACTHTTKSLLLKSIFFISPILFCFSMQLRRLDRP